MGIKELSELIPLLPDSTLQEKVETVTLKTEAFVHREEISGSNPSILISLIICPPRIHYTNFAYFAIIF